jgi:hypothetical protein
MKFLSLILFLSLLYYFFTSNPIHSTFNNPLFMSGFSDEEILDYQTKIFKETGVPVTFKQPIKFDERTQKKPPFLFIPGLGASPIDVKLVNFNKSHVYCSSNFDYLASWIKIENLAVPLKRTCFFDYFEPTFSLEKKRILNKPGVFTRPTNYNSINSLECLITGVLCSKSYYLHVLIEYFKSKHGYVPDEDLFAWTFDWRFGPKEFMEGQYYKDLKELIEKIYEKKDRQKIIILGHSVGVTVFSYFLANYVNQEWKDKYIKLFVSMGGPFDGSTYAPGTMVHGLS